MSSSDDQDAPPVPLNIDAPAVDASSALAVPPFAQAFPEQAAAAVAEAEQKQQADADAPMDPAPVAAAAAPTPVATADASTAAPAPAPVPLPSDAQLRSAIRVLLVGADLTQLTPKLVRTGVCKSLGLPLTQMMESADFKAQTKQILSEEVDVVKEMHAAKSSAKEKADAEGGGHKSKSHSHSAKKESKGKKNKIKEEEAKAEDAEGSSAAAEEAHASKKQKTSASKSKAAAASSKAASSSAVDDAEIERLAAEADENDGAEDDAGSEAMDTQEDADAALAASLAASDRRPRRAAAAAATSASKKKASSVKKPRDPNAPKREPKKASISAALQDFFDGQFGAEMNRGEIVKQLWVYIKAHNLQDPSDGRKILCDAKMKSIFGDRKSVQMMKMSSLMQKHIKNKDQLTATSTA